MYKILNNQFNIPEELLFCLGKRDGNVNRNFLFISKLLGKHLPVDPDIVKASGFLLASLKYSFDNQPYIQCIAKGIRPFFDVVAHDDKVLVIGLCETATALGMSVAASIKDSHYIMSTREPIQGVKQILRFEEPHSHASTHAIYSNELDLNRFEEVILVDDEITTGISLLNLIKELVRDSNVRKFSIFTILDWRNNQMKDAFGQIALDLSLNINVYSLVSGNLCEPDNLVYRNLKTETIEKEIISTSLNVFDRRVVHNCGNSNVSYVVHTGRFGLCHNEICKIEDFAKDAAQMLSEYIDKGKSTLVLGHGENIYIPSRIASGLKTLGNNVAFRTTSRTPIYCDGRIIKDFETFYDRGVRYYFYNRNDAEKYDKVVMLADTPFNKEICNNMLVFNL